MFEEVTIGECRLSEVDRRVRALPATTSKGEMRNENELVRCILGGAS